MRLKFDQRIRGAFGLLIMSVVATGCVSTNSAEQVSVPGQPVEQTDEEKAEVYRNSMKAQRMLMRRGSSFAQTSRADLFGDAWRFYSFHVGSDSDGEFWVIREANGGYKKKVSVRWASSRTCSEVSSVVEEVRDFDVGGRAVPVLQTGARDTLEDRVPMMDGSVYVLTIQQLEPDTALTFSQKEGSLAVWYERLDGRLRNCPSERPGKILGDSRGDL